MKKTAKYTSEDLAIMQADALPQKISRSQTRLIEWYIKWDQQVYVSFSGGKDSTVLADMTARICKETGWPLNLLFINTGLEYPEIREFVEEFAAWLREQYGITVNLHIRKPTDRKGATIGFDTVIQRKGYPMISKEVAHVLYGARRGQASCLRKLNGEKKDHNGDKSRFNCEKYKGLVDAPFVINSDCCEVMKKSPAHKFESETGLKLITGEMAQESVLRKSQWLMNGCNGFDSERPKSTPMAFWTEQDALRYIYEFKIPIAKVYGDIVPADPQESVFSETTKFKTTGCDRTGCIFCGFGLAQECAKGENRFQRLKATHPVQYEYCMREPKVIIRETGTEIMVGESHTMTWAFNKRRQIGDKAFEEEYKVVGGLGMQKVLEYLGFEH